MLTDQGKIYSFGIGNIGQLGRLKLDECTISELIPKENGDGENGEEENSEKAKQLKEERRKKLRANYLIPKIVQFEDGREFICDKIWANYSCSFAREKQTGQIYGWGTNNWCQLGLPQEERVLFPKPINFPLDSHHKIISIANGQFHMLALDESGKVYSAGRKFYGALGHGEIPGDQIDAPKLIEHFKDEKVVSISAATDYSFAVTESGIIINYIKLLIIICLIEICFLGKLYSWGAESSQTGHKTECLVPTEVNFKEKDNNNMIVLSVTAGSQHTTLIARETQQNGY